MSFLTSRAFTALRTSAFPPVARTFATTTQHRKTATEVVKDTLKTVDRAVADKIVDGIEIGGRPFYFLPSFHLGQFPHPCQHLLARDRASPSIPTSHVPLLSFLQKPRTFKLQIKIFTLF